MTHRLPIAAAAGLAVAALAAPAANAGVFRFHDEEALGTRLNILVLAADEPEAQHAARAARAEIDRLDAVLNSRRPDSELFALNRAGRFTASQDLFAVVEAAERQRETTGGAYSGRLGRLVGLWREAGDAPPAQDRLARVAQAANAAAVVLNAETRTITRPDAVLFELDGLAKGYIIDKALAAGMAASPKVRGLLVDIGGDMRCAGAAPGGGWTVGLPDPMAPADNARLVCAVTLSERAIATSGRGPRDRLIAHRVFSPTLSPATGWPVEAVVAASVVAPRAAEADALASACLVLEPADGLALAERLPGVAARLTDTAGRVHASSGWRRLADEAPADLFRAQTATPPNAWPANWQALFTFTAPRRQRIRDPDFRSPYMAMWVTDPNNRPVRTLILVGKSVPWQKDNFIWWGLNRPQAERLVSVRSMSTSGAGVYNVFWDGVDDAGRPVPSGRYILHVETSRERGKHTYRSLPVDFTNPVRFKGSLAPTEEGGGLDVSFDRY